MSVEKFFYERLGVRKEYSRLNPFAAALVIGISNVYARLSGLTIEGSIPSYGAAIFISNHIDEFDGLRMFRAGVCAVRDEQGPTRGRILRGVGKSTLFGIPEPQAVREKTNKRGFLNSDNPLFKIAVRVLIGVPLSGAGVIPVRRGFADRFALRQIRHAIEDQQGVVLSIIESRDQTGGLEDLKPGAAYLLKTHPETPAYLVAISQHPNVVRISEVFTYSQRRRERGDLDLKELMLYLADGIIELQPPHIQERWRLVGRDIEYQKLYANKRQSMALDRL